MFGWFKKRKSYTALLEDVCKLSGELSEAQSDVRKLTKANEVLTQKAIDTAEERDAIGESFDQMKEDNDNLYHQVATLSEALGHAIHGLAAFQSFSDGIQKRLAMLPDNLGLPKDLASEILQGFDQDLEERKDFARDLERQSVTVEMNASDDGYLILNSEGERTSLTVDQVEDALFGAASHVGEPSPEWDVVIDAKTVTAIKELGLYQVPVDFGKGVKVEVKVWVVPTVTD